MVENFKGENILCKAREDSTHQPEEGGCAEGPPHSLTRDAAFSGGPRPSWGNLSGNKTLQPGFPFTHQSHASASHGPNQNEK